MPSLAYFADFIAKPGVTSIAAMEKAAQTAIENRLGADVFRRFPGVDTALGQLLDAATAAVDSGDLLTPENCDRVLTLIGSEDPPIAGPLAGWLLCSLIEDGAHEAFAAFRLAIERVAFQGNVNAQIEAVAAELAAKYQFVPANVFSRLQMFGMDFFANTPHVPAGERADWLYFRDGLSHSALIFNTVTREIRFIFGPHYWPDDEVADYRDGQPGEPLPRPATYFRFFTFHEENGEVFSRHRTEAAAQKLARRHNRNLLPEHRLGVGRL